MIADNHTLQLVRQNKDPQIAHARSISKRRPVQLATAHALQEHQRILLTQPPEEPQTDQIQAPQTHQTDQVQALKAALHETRELVRELLIAYHKNPPTDQPIPAAVIKAHQTLTNPPEIVRTLQNPLQITPPTNVNIIFTLKNPTAIATIQGATTSEPPDQEMLNIFPLIQQILGDTFPASFPITLGGTGIPTITVPQDSIQDVALSAYSSLFTRALA